MSVCRQCVSGVPAPRCHDDKSAGGVPRTGVDPDGTCELLQTNRADFLTAPKPPRETASETREARVTFPTPTPARIPSPQYPPPSRPLTHSQDRSCTLKITQPIRWYTLPHSLPHPPTPPNYRKCRGESPSWYRPIIVEGDATSRYGRNVPLLIHNSHRSFTPVRGWSMQLPA